MLEQLRIRNYRGFKDLQVDGFSRVNLVAGKNNAGKTTLLEAILLLGSGGDAGLALNNHVVRLESTTAVPTSISETVWTSLFCELKTDGAFTISGRHASVGTMELKVSLERPDTKEIPRSGEKGALAKGHSGERALKFTYVDPVVGTLETEARETANEIKIHQTNTYVAFGGAFLQPRGGNLQQDAVHLAHLRRQKRGDLLVDALRVVEPRLQSIEDNASSGAPMIWADIGMHELVPLPDLGVGMTRLARIVLSATTVQGGVVLVDQIENGLHHSVLPDVWRTVRRVAEQFNVQVFATTYSFECVEAAYEALGADGFRLHRLETVDGVNQCVTYEADALKGAIRHNLEVR